MIQRQHSNQRMSQLVSFANLVWTAGQVAKQAGEHLRRLPFDARLPASRRRPARLREDLDRRRRGRIHAGLTVEPAAAAWRGCHDWFGRCC